MFRLLRVVVLLSLWRVILTAHDTAGMTLGTTLTYTLIQEVFAEQLLPRTNIEWALHDGGIAMRFLQPLDLVSQFMAHIADLAQRGVIEVPRTACCAPQLPRQCGGAVALTSPSLWARVLTGVRGFQRLPGRSDAGR